MANDLPHYFAWLLRQPCAVNPIDPCVAAVVVHHHTEGETHAPDARPPKALGGKRGKSQKASDYYGLPLCPRHHGLFHDAKGFCRDWTKSDRRAWQDDQVLIHRQRYEAENERRGIDVVEVPGAEVPDYLERPTRRLKPLPSGTETERIAILKIIDDYKAAARLHPEAVQACEELAELISARGQTTSSPKRVAPF